MKYNDNAKRWVSKEGLVYREQNGQLVLCKQSNHGHKPKFYKSIKSQGRTWKVHRLVWETFNGPIPKNMCIDHIDTDRTNNRLQNLHLVTPKENSNNALTLDRIRKFNKKHNVPRTEFGKKFAEHFGTEGYANKPLWTKEHEWFKRNGHCRWEVK